MELKQGDIVRVVADLDKTSLEDHFGAVDEMYAFQGKTVVIREVGECVCSAHEPLIRLEGDNDGPRGEGWSWTPDCFEPLDA